MRRGSFLLTGKLSLELLENPTVHVHNAVLTSKEPADRTADLSMNPVAEACKCSCKCCRLLRYSEKTIVKPTQRKHGSPRMLLVTQEMVLWGRCKCRQFCISST